MGYPLAAIEAFRRSTAELRSHAGASGDGEIREAAADVCQQFATTLESASGLLAAQRKRSKHVADFFITLINRERRFHGRCELEATSDQLRRLRESMLRTMNEHEVAFARFHAIVKRSSGLSCQGWPPDPQHLLNEFPGATLIVSEIYNLGTRNKRTRANHKRFARSVGGDFTPQPSLL